MWRSRAPLSVLVPALLCTGLLVAACSSSSTGTGVEDALVVPADADPAGSPATVLVERASGPADPVPPAVNEETRPPRGLLNVSRTLWIEPPAPWTIEERGLDAATRPGGERGENRICQNRAWFDFLVGADLPWARELIATETVDVTTAIRRWDELSEQRIELFDREALELLLPGQTANIRSIYLIPFPGGTLALQVMTMGGGGPQEPCAEEHRARAAELVAAFATSETASAWAERHADPSERTQPNVLEPVPTTLQECFVALERELSPEDLQTLRDTPEAEMARFHLSLGMGLRNRWGLWGGSPLAQHLAGLGLRHPDDMSGLILTSFWRHLHGVPLDVEGQVAAYQRYWEAAGTGGGGGSGSR